MEKRLNSNHLKLIAIIAMTVDHFTDLFYPGFPIAVLPIAMHLIGRLTAPIMWFFIAEGYHYTKNIALKINSAAFLADAWHHRSDALSSVGALVGIGGAMMGFPVMDSIASIVIFVFIAKAAYDIFKDAMDKMVDHSCDDETENEMRDFVLAQNEVLSVDLLHTRIFGNKIYVDVEIGVNGSYTLRHAHEIAEEVHEGIEKNFPKVKHVMVHVNPADVA